MSAQDFYKKRVMALRQPFIEATQDGYILMGTLSTLLGCVLMRDHGREQDNTHAINIEKHEPLVRRTLVDLLQYAMARQNTRDALIDKYSILDGLAKNNRWRACLQTSQTCYDLVGLLVLVASSFVGRPENASMCRTFDPNICTILNAWLNPETAFKAIPTADVLVRDLFGDPWCDIVLAENANFMLTHELVRTIRTVRPPLREGLLPGVAQVGIALPVLA